jgi:putative redox protein
MKSVVRWTEGYSMEAETESGKLTSIYSEVAPSPMEMVLQAHAACSLIDLRVGLKDRMENVRAMWVDVEGVRADQSPRVFTSVKMHYVVEGDVPEKLVRRIISLSHQKDCSVGIMISRSGASVEWTLDLCS